MCSVCQQKSLILGSMERLIEETEDALHQLNPEDQKSIMSNSAHKADDPRANNVARELIRRIRRVLPLLPVAHY